MPIKELLPADSQKLSYERRRAIGCFLDLCNVPAQLVLTAETFLGVLAVADDHAQHIIEIMSQATGQATDCFHPLSTQELVLHALCGRHVAFDGEKALGPVHFDPLAIDINVPNFSIACP